MQPAQDWKQRSTITNFSKFTKVPNHSQKGAVCGVIKFQPRALKGRGRYIFIVNSSSEIGLLGFPAARPVEYRLDRKYIGFAGKLFHGAGRGISQEIDERPSAGILARHGMDVALF